MQAAPKRGDFVRLNALQQSMLIGGLWHNIPNTTDNAKNLKRNVSQTREQHSLKALTTFNNISKSNHNDTYRENNRKIQRKVGHNSEKRILFFLPCDQPSIRSVALGVRRQSEDCNSTARRIAECTSETKPLGKAFIIDRANSNSGMQSRDSLRNSPEMHCKISVARARATRSIASTCKESTPKLIKV